jgi:hypothetical protein
VTEVVKHNDINRNTISIIGACKVLEDWFPHFGPPHRAGKEKNNV